MAESEYGEGTTMKQFEILQSISSYNYNYHIGFGKDLLFALSDDDNTTEWWIVAGQHFKYLGESLVSEGDVLHRYPERQT